MNKFKTCILFGDSAACPWVSSSGDKLDFAAETAKALRYLRDLRDKVYAE